MIMHKINVSLIAGLTVLAVVTGPAAMVLAQAPAGAGLDVRGNRETMTKERIKLFGEKAVRRLTTALDRADGFRQRVALHASQFSNPRFDKTVVDQKLVAAGEAVA